MMLQKHKNFNSIVSKVITQSSTQKKKIERLISKQNKNKPFFYADEKNEAFNAQQMKKAANVKISLDNEQQSE